MGVIDSLGKGFQSVHRHWWVLLIPILLDVFLWIGPHASIQEMMQETVQSLRADLTDSPIGSDETVDWGEVFTTLLTEVIPQYNALSALRIGTLGVPSLMTWGGARLGSPSSYEVIWVIFLLTLDMPDLLVSVSSSAFIDVVVWQLPNEGVWLLVILTMSVLGIFLGSAYITLISHSIDQGGAFWSRMFWFGVRFALFWVLRFVLLLAMGIPLLMVATVLAAFSPGVASLFTTIVLGLLAWFSFYGIFFVAALAINNVSIWRAIWNSFNVVLRNFWATVGLYLLINLIGGGLTILWQQLSTGSWLTLVGIVGNAYVGTSLVTAALFFYQDRYAHWQALVAELLRHSKRLT